MALSGSDPDKTWQQIKSENTRIAILDAALRCLYEVGYNNTTTGKVARYAGVSRGAMLHHFPSRRALLTATVAHLSHNRLAQFEEQERKINEGAAHSRVEEGIDAYWEQLHSPLFTVFHELHVASRTDSELREILVPALREFDESWRKTAESVFPDLAVSEQFNTANLLTLFLLEGMAVRGVKGGEIPRIILPWLKTELRRMFADVKDVARDSPAKG